MNRTADLKLSERVILIDVSFLNQTVKVVREVMSARLGRPLPMFDLVAWLDCLLLDAGIRDFSSAEVQVLLVQGADGDALSVCTPSLLSDLDGKACRTGLAEYVFGVVPTEKLATAEALYHDLLPLVLNNVSVKVVWFRMEELTLPSICQWCLVVPSLAYVLGIREEELN